MVQQIDPFEFNASEAPADAPTSPGVPPFASNMDKSTAISHYNRLDGVKSVLSDMRLKMGIEVERKGPVTLHDSLYMGRLVDLISMCNTLQTLLPWSPFPKDEL